MKFREYIEEGRRITGKSLGIKYTGARSFARQMAAIERGGSRKIKNPSWKDVYQPRSTNEKEFDMLNNIRLALEIRKGNEFFLSVAGFEKVSDKQLAAAKKILMSTPLMKKLVRLAKEMSWQEASKIHTEKIKNRDLKDAKYYSLVSSPLHWDFLRNL